jgi:Zn/Cd-binding protein ZinT
VKNFYKLTPEVDKRCKVIASTLSDMQKTDKHGKPLSRKNTKFKGLTDVQIENRRITKAKKNWQTVSEPLLVNHYLELVTAYQQRGEKGIEDYTGRIQYLKSVYDAQNPSKPTTP